MTDYTNIYLITNKITRKVYVGKTVKPVSKRFIEHKSSAKTGIKTYLYKSIRAHGPENFYIQQIDRCRDEVASRTEQNYIQLFQSHRPMRGYNLTLGGEGTRPNEESRKHKSEVMRRLGIKPPGNTGYERTPEWRKNISLGNKGKVAWNKDKKLSPEHVQSLKSSHPRIELPIQEISRLYLDEGLSCASIAPQFGVSSETLARRLKDAGVLMRPTGHNQYTTKKESIK